MKKRYYVLAFLAVLVCVLLLDATVLQGVLLRDLLFPFVREGMQGETVKALIGVPLRDVGSGLAIMEYALPFGHHFYVSYAGGPAVVAVSEAQPSYLLRGMLLPAILLFVALVEIATYWIRRN